MILAKKKIIYHKKKGLLHIIITHTSFINNKNRNGPRLDTRGTPDIKKYYNVGKLGPRDLPYSPSRKKNSKKRGRYNNQITE